MNQLIGKDPGAGKDWRQKKKRATEDEMFGCNHWFSGHEFGQTLGDGEGQGSLVCCGPWDCEELNMTWWLNDRPCDEEDIFFFLVLVLEGPVGLHRTIQLQLIWYQWLGNRFRLVWCWMVFLGNELSSFCCFGDCTQVMHFILSCWQ